MAIGKLIQKDGKLLFSNGDLWSADDATSCDCNCGSVPDPCLVLNPYPLLQSGTYQFFLGSTIESQFPNTTLFTAGSGSHPFTQSSTSGFRTTLDYRFRLNPANLPQLDFTNVFTVDNQISASSFGEVLASGFARLSLRVDPPTPAAQYILETYSPGSGIDYWGERLTRNGTTLDRFTQGEPEWTGLNLSVRVTSYTNPFARVNEIIYIPDIDGTPGTLLIRNKTVRWADCDWLVLNMELLQSAGNNSVATFQSSEVLNTASMTVSYAVTP